MRALVASAAQMPPRTPRGRPVPQGAAPGASPNATAPALPHLPRLPYGMSRPQRSPDSVELPISALSNDERAARHLRWLRNPQELQHRPRNVGQDAVAAHDSPRPLRHDEVERYAARRMRGELPSRVVFHQLLRHAVVRPDEVG